MSLYLTFLTFFCDLWYICPISFTGRYFFSFIHKKLVVNWELTFDISRLGDDMIFSFKLNEIPALLSRLCSSSNSFSRSLTVLSRSVVQFLSPCLLSFMFDLRSTSNLGHSSLLLASLDGQEFYYPAPLNSQQRNFFIYGPGMEECSSNYQVYCSDESSLKF